MGDSLGQPLIRQLKLLIARSASGRQDARKLSVVGTGRPSAVIHERPLLGRTADVLDVTKRPAAVCARPTDPGWPDIDHARHNSYRNLGVRVRDCTAGAAARDGRERREPGAMSARQRRISTGQTFSAANLRLVIDGRMLFRRPGPAPPELCEAHQGRQAHLLRRRRRPHAALLS